MLTTKEAPPPLDVLDAHERESLRALLEARTEPDRLQAAYQLRRVVARAARETSGETFGRFGHSGVFGSGEDQLKNYS